MFCPECGFKIPDDSKFCMNCGKNFAKILISKQNDEERESDFTTRSSKTNASSQTFSKR